MDKRGEGTGEVPAHALYFEGCQRDDTPLTCVGVGECLHDHYLVRTERCVRSTTPTALWQLSRIRQMRMRNALKAREKC